MSHLDSKVSSRCRLLVNYISCVNTVYRLSLPCSAAARRACLRVLVTHGARMTAHYFVADARFVTHACRTCSVCRRTEDSSVRYCNRIWWSDPLPDRIRWFGGFKSAARRTRTARMGCSSSNTNRFHWSRSCAQIRGICRSSFLHIADWNSRHDECSFVRQIEMRLADRQTSHISIILCKIILKDLFLIRLCE